MNVLLVLHTDENQHLILPEVAKELCRSGVRSRGVWDLEPRFKHRLWTLGRRTVVVSMTPIKNFTPQWATLWQQVKCDKIYEAFLLEQAGIPTPRQRALYRGVETDLSEFDDYVVVKPARGGCGAFVRVMRRAKARWRPIAVDIVKSGVNEALIAQDYIHTGPWPTSYRVGTVFGEPIYALRIVADRSRKPIDPEKGDWADAFAGSTIVASSKGCTMSTDVPEDVLQFARRVHRAFPTIPLLGTDILREHNTGKLYALEVNPTGSTLHFDNEKSARLKSEFGIDLYAQFGGAKAIARGIYRRLFNPMSQIQENSACKSVPEPSELESAEIFASGRNHVLASSERR